MLWRRGHRAGAGADESALQAMANPAALRSAQTLGHLGLLPFFALAAAAWLPADALIGGWRAAQLAQFALVGYAAAVLSFLGGVHWGVVVSSASIHAKTARQLLGWGVVPSLLGWLALLMSLMGVQTWIVFAILIGDLLLVRLMDGALLRQLPVSAGGFLELRTRLTAGAMVALALALAAAL